MLRTRFSFPACFGLTVAPRAQGLYSDGFSGTSLNTTIGASSTQVSDSNSATFNREGAGNTSQISAGSIASIDYLTVTTIPEPGIFALLLGALSGPGATIVRRKVLSGTKTDVSDSNPLPPRG